MTAAIADPAEVLERAADEIERRGLHRGQYFDTRTRAGYLDLANCRVCALGAIGWVVQGHPTLYHEEFGDAGVRPAVLAAETDQVWDHDYDPTDYDLHECITIWSDGLDTAAEVAAAMRTAARKLRENTGVDVSVWDVREGQQTVRGDRLVVVTKRAHGVDLATGRDLDDLYLTWQSSETDADGIPVVSGRTYIEPDKDETVRLVSVPAVIDVPGVAL